MFYSDSCIMLWRNFAWKFDRRELADEQLMAADMRLFQRVGPLIEGVVFQAEADANWQRAAAAHLPDFLQTLNRGQLAGLKIEQVPLLPAATQALAQFRQLRQLGVSSSCVAARNAGSLAAAVHQLTSMDAFQFQGNSVGRALVAALRPLVRLEYLDLESTQVPLPDLSPLTALAGILTSLRLVERESHGSGLLLPSSRLP